MFNFKLYGSNVIVILRYYYNKMYVVSDADSSPALYYKWAIVTMRLSCTVTEIERLKDNGVTTLTLWGHVV